VEVHVYDWCSFLPLNVLYEKLDRPTVIKPSIYKLLEPKLELVFFDVGDGDSVLITTPDGNRLLVDGGGVEENRYDTARSILLPSFLKMGIRRLDQVLVTHAHADHCFGIINLLECFPVKKAYVTQRKKKPELLINYEKRVLQKNVVPLRLHSFPENPLYDLNENNHSVVLKVSYGSFSVLLTGDIEKEVEDSLLAYGDHLNATVLKVAHHGSRTSSTRPFLELVDARTAIVSSSARNMHGHPHQEVLSRLASGMAPCSTFVTGKRGALTVISDGNSYQVKAGKRTLQSSGDLWYGRPRPCLFYPS